MSDHRYQLPPDPAPREKTQGDGSSRPVRPGPIIAKPAMPAAAPSLSMQLAEAREEISLLRSTLHGLASLHTLADQLGHDVAEAEQRRALKPTPVDVSSPLPTTHFIWRFIVNFTEKLIADQAALAAEVAELKKLVADLVNPLPAPPPPPVTSRPVVAKETQEQYVTRKRARRRHIANRKRATWRRCARDCRPASFAMQMELLDGSSTANP